MLLFIDNEANYSCSGFDLNSLQQLLDTFCWYFMLLDVTYVVDAFQAECWLTELGWDYFRDVAYCLKNSLKCWTVRTKILTPPSYTHLSITVTLVNDALMSWCINLSMNIYDCMIQKNCLTVDFIFLSLQWISYYTCYIHFYVFFKFYAVFMKMTAFRVWRYNHKAA